MSSKKNSAKKPAKNSDMIVLQGVSTHNLKHIDVSLPKDHIITITGVSGSGKSSLAFDTIYKEGQFRYIESLSSYLRQFFNLGTRPDLEYSSGLSPAIAIEQNKRVGNSRSTVGTLTETDDYLRLLMAKTGEVYCHCCGKPLRPKTTPEIVDDIKANFLGEKVYLLQELGEFHDAKELSRFVKKNRKQVDQGSGVTRFVLALNYDKEHNTYDSMVEYFYLEDPNVPDELLPVKVFGVFDRVTINDSTLKRLKDDAIKMLGRAEKFGVYAASVIQHVQAEKKSPTQTDASPFIVSSAVDVSAQRKEMLLHHAHSRDGFVESVRAIIKNEHGEVLTLLEKDTGCFNEPGGKVAAGESRHDALKREIKEETGLKVKKVSFIGDNKVFYNTGCYHIYLYEVETTGTPKVCEPEKIDEVVRSSITLDKRSESGIRIAFGEKHKSSCSYEELSAQGSYEIRSYATDLHKNLTHGDLPFECLPREHIDPSVQYVCYVDLKAGVYKFMNYGEFRKSPHRLLLYVIGGKDLLSGYDIMFGKTHTESDKVQEIVRYTDKYYCPTDNISYPEFTTQHFSSNRQEGACPTCHGVGEELQADMEKIIDPFSPYLKAILPRRDSNLGQGILKKLASVYDIDVTATRNNLPGRFQDVVINGDDELLRISKGGGKYISMYYKGVQDVLTSQYNKGVLTVDFQAMLDFRPCRDCHGAKLRKESLHVYLLPDKLAKDEERQLIALDQIKEKYNIYELQSMSMERMAEVISRYQVSGRAPLALLERITNPLLDRIQTIAELGLGYMITARQIDSLSGGEIQRLRLAKQLGNKLTGIIYVLDEPTIGLDEKEIKKVIAAIKELQAMGNTIIVVEHNEAFIKASDRIVEVGPGAGDFGGNILFNGSYKDFLKSNTLTAQYINGEKRVTASFDHTPMKQILSIKKASKHNLKNIDVDIQLGSFTIITGPSGAGKTTLMYHTLFKFLSDKQQFIQSYIRLQLLKQGMSRSEIVQAPILKRDQYEHLEKRAVQEFYEYIGVETILGYEEIENVLYVDQSSIGKTPRSCPATFIGVFDDIRKLYAGVTEAKMLAFNSGHFSFNSSKGACPECKGYGHKKVELQFLPDTYVPCSLCKGRRYKPEILDIKWHDKTISQVLEMYVMDAYEFFEDMPFIGEKLRLMMEIGLGYLKMGQPAHTLSGGESQRLKLVKHLLKQYRGHTVYFLDEPTVGLHPSDIDRLLDVLKKFLDNGDSILMIEHEKNLLQFADNVIRLEDGKIVKKNT